MTYASTPIWNHPTGIRIFSKIDIPRKQKQSSAKPLKCYENNSSDPKEAMAKAYLSGHYTFAEVGAWFGYSYATVSRAVKAIEKSTNLKCEM